MDNNAVIELYQVATLVIVVLFMNFLERSRPGYVVDRKHDLWLNILALFVVIIIGEICKATIFSGLNLLHPAPLRYSGLYGLPSLFKILLGLIFGDLSLYCVHRAMHRPFLWKTHTFHHSIDQLWWLSGSRTSAAHLFLFAAPQVFITKFLLDLSAGEAAVAFSFGILVNVWIHTNIKVDLGRLGWLLITPDYHRVHHGARGLSNRNLGFVLSIWDRLFGTYLDPKSLHGQFSLGFVQTKKKLFRMIIGL